MINDVCDRRKYRFKGYLIRPNEDKEIVFYYYILENYPTFAPSFERGIETLKITYQIEVFGDLHFIKGDIVKLNKGSAEEIELKVYTIKPTLFEPNILIADLIKTRIINSILVLQ